MAGLMIDDFLIVDRRKRGEPPTRAAEIMKAVADKYEEVGLPRHSGKSVVDELKSSFWGSQMDGDRGEVDRFDKMCSPRSADSSSTSAGNLLGELAGSFKRFLCCRLAVRRRLMSSLEEI